MEGVDGKERLRNTDGVGLRRVEMMLTSLAKGRSWGRKASQAEVKGVHR